MCPQLLSQLEEQRSALGQRQVEQGPASKQTPSVDSEPRCHSLCLENHCFMPRKPTWRRKHGFNKQKDSPNRKHFQTEKLIIFLTKKSKRSLTDSLNPGRNSAATGSFLVASSQGGKEQTGTQGNRTGLTLRGTAQRQLPLSFSGCSMTY